MPKVVTEYDIELAKWNAKIAEIKRDMKQMQEDAKKQGIGEKLFGGIKGFMPALGAVGAGAAIKGVLSHFDEINDVATKLGETPEVIQRVERAAKLSGSSIEGLSGAVIKLEKNLGDVENTKVADILESYGLSVENLMSMPLDEKIAALADAFKKARDDGNGVYELQELLGKSSAELIPLFEEGGEALRKMYGGTNVVANEAVYQMAALNDQIDNVIGNVTNLAGQALMYLHDALARVGAKIAEVFGDEGASDKVERAIQKRADDAQDKAMEMANRRAKRSFNMEQNHKESAAAKQIKEEADAAKKAAEEEESRAKRIDKLKADIENKRLSMLPDDQQLAEYKAKLQALYEDVNFVDASMDGLDEAIRMAVDAADEERLLGLKKQAMEWQGEIDNLTEKGQKTKTETVKTASTPGDVAAAINTIFGRSANELILDESKRQTQLMERMDKSLRQIADGGDTDPFNQEVFAFP